MTFNIAVICPVIDTGIIDAEAELQPLQTAEVCLRSYYLREGPATIETEADEEAALPDLLRLAQELQDQGADALVINCMNDPGIERLQSDLRIPVFGPARSSMLAAAMVGRRFALLDVVNDARDQMTKIARRSGAGAMMAGFRSIDIHVQNLRQDPELTLAALTREATVAIWEDKAEVLILGCTVLSIFGEPLAAKLSDLGLQAQVVEPFSTTVRLAAALVANNHQQSRKAQ